MILIIICDCYCCDCECYYVVVIYIYIYIYKSVDDHFGHIITGNLNIKNEDVKRLFIKGLNFREKQPLNVDKAYASIQSAIDSYISNALKIAIHLFSPWKSFVLNKVKTFSTNHINIQLLPP